MLLQVERVMIIVALQNVNCTHDSQVTEEVNRCHDSPPDVEPLLVLGTFDRGRGEPGAALCCSNQRMISQETVCTHSQHMITQVPAGDCVCSCVGIQRTLRRIGLLLTN